MQLPPYLGTDQKNTVDLKKNILYALAVSNKFWVYIGSSVGSIRPLMLVLSNVLATNAPRILLVPKR